MSTPLSAVADSGEDVTDFLRRIKELGDKRDREDAERTRKLEDEIMEGRRQREARRAERARSLSPEKQSEPGTPRAIRSPPTLSDSMASMYLETPSSISTLGDVQEKSLTSHAPRASSPRELSPRRPLLEEPAKPSPSSAMPTRSATLSWQQRPTSIRGPRSRPLSMVHQTQQSPSPSTHPSRDDEPEASRANISKALAAKDPTFFRQTADRGMGSAAFRKNQVEETDTVDHSRSATPMGRQLHGLSRQTPTESTDFLVGARSSTSSPMIHTGSPLVLSSSPAAPRLDPSPPMVTRPNNATENTARVASRPASPTKGMGGFVSSAMLRSDSDSKRWSTQQSSAGGLTRADSSARARRLNRTGSKDGIPLASSTPHLGGMSAPTLKASQEPSAAMGASPSASHGGDLPTNESQSRPESSMTAYGRPTTPNADRSSITSPTSSPTKRWSPTKNKSSWLESALGRPESPKPTPLQAPSNQPSWLADLNKNRQQRMSKELSADTVRHVMLQADLGPNLGKNDGPQAQRPGDRPVPQPTQAPPPRFKPARLSEGRQEDKLEDKPVAKNAVASVQVPEVEVRREAPQPSTKVKCLGSRAQPSTPPNNDFRSSLRSTPASPEKQQDEPEFKSAVGKLKRAQTQNYKAPDILKSNITAGKAALSVTDGPQKTVHRDEFKESILERKKTMKESVPDPRLLHKPKPVVEKREEPIPEALAKRSILGRSENSGNVQSPVGEGKTAPTTAGRQQPIGAAIVAHKLATEPSENKLAGRFNPGLASLIARGPGPAAGTPKSPDREIGRSPMPTTASGLISEEPESGGQLQHMTKARARGPKRRAPKTTVETNAPQAVAKAGAWPVLRSEPASPLKSRIEITKKPTLPSSSRRVSASTKLAAENAQKAPNPSTSASKLAPAEMIPKEPAKSVYQKPKIADLVIEKDVGETLTNGGQSGVQSSPSLSKIERPKSISVKDATAKWIQQSQPAAPERVKLPIKLPTRSEEAQAIVEAPGTPTAPTKGSALGLANIGKPGTPTASAMPAIVAKPATLSMSTLGTPKTGEKASAGEQLRNASNGSIHGVAKSPGSQASDAGTIMQDFFGAIPCRPSGMDIDTQAILSASSQGDAKIKTIRKDVFEVTADGKKTALPSHHEHILYSEAMYVCTHVFGDPRGARFTEIYFWIGASVSESAAEDAQVFAKRAAREANGTLVVLHQGKESAAFMQAAGGILITRRGSSRQAAFAQRPVMLCGRRYFGHVVFDEVDFALSSLTAGFAFISMAQAGKIYVWIGSGCHAEELGSARLIAMDLGPAAEVVEVEEGSEGGDFLSQFPEPRRVSRSAEHWKRKPAHNNYRTRLYKMVQGPAAGPAAPINALWGALTRRPSHPDASAGQVRVEEVVPFAQSDLEDEHVYVLDAFFEMYILPGALSGSNGTAFATALLFAQDYGMMAASLEDRPFVPVSTVVMSGVPRDMKASFRAWDSARLNSGALMGGSGTGCKAPLKIIGLNAAIAALKTG